MVYVFFGTQQHPATQKREGTNAGYVNKLLAVAFSARGLNDSPKSVNTVTNDFPPDVDDDDDGELLDNIIAEDDDDGVRPALLRLLPLFPEPPPALPCAFK